MFPNEYFRCGRVQFKWLRVHDKLSSIACINRPGVAAKMAGDEAQT